MSLRLDVLINITKRYNPAGEAKVAHIALRFYGALTLGQAYIVCEYHPPGTSITYGCGVEAL